MRSDISAEWVTESHAWDFDCSRYKVGTGSCFKFARRLSKTTSPLPHLHKITKNHLHTSNILQKDERYSSLAAQLHKMRSLETGLIPVLFTVGKTNKSADLQSRFRKQDAVVANYSDGITIQPGETYNNMAFASATEVKEVRRRHYRALSLNCTKAKTTHQKFIDQKNGRERFYKLLVHKQNKPQLHASR